MAEIETESATDLEMAEIETESATDPEVNEAPIQDTEVEPPADEKAADNGTAGLKRAREQEEGEEEGAKDRESNEEGKRQKSDESVEEELLEKKTEEEEKKSGTDPEPEPERESEPEAKSGPIDLGAKKFQTSLEIFDYFYKFLHFWTPNVNVNKYEHVMLLELLKKGHLEPDKKIGCGICAFQVRYHPKYKSRCFFLTREDNSEDDFSFRKCVEHIGPLPENMQVKHDVNKALGAGYGGKGGRGGGRGHGRWRGGKSRN